MNCHLVAVEVSVESRARQGMELNGFTLDEHGEERLDTETVQRGGTVEQYGMVLDDVIKNIKDYRILSLNHLLGILDSGTVTPPEKFPDNERIKELQAHLLGKSAFIEMEFRPNNNNGTTRIIDAFPEQVLAKAPLFALEHIAEGLEWTVVMSLDGTKPPGIVEEGVNGFLQHAFFIFQDNFRSPEFNQLAKAIVSVDYPAVKIVEV
jgi:hypothetical protein